MAEASTSCWTTLTSFSACPRQSAGTATSASDSGLLIAEVLRYNVSPLWCKCLIRGRMHSKNTDSQLDTEGFTTHPTLSRQENNSHCSCSHFSMRLSSYSGLSTDHRVGGLIPTSCCPHVKVSLGKTLKPGLLHSYRGCPNQCIPNFLINGNSCIRKGIQLEKPMVSQMCGS